MIRALAQPIAEIGVDTVNSGIRLTRAGSDRLEETHGIGGLDQTRDAFALGIIPRRYCFERRVQTKRPDGDFSASVIVRLRRSYV
jgi:hypothetical protein